MPKSKRFGRASIFAAMLAMLLTLGGCAFIEKINKITIDTTAARNVKDGTYEGSQSAFPVTAAVRVTVSGGRITDIVMLSHGHGPNHGADAILPRVIAAQGLGVDAVSGSTYSSKVVLKAIETALKKGH
jgi:uncharacterized protein with FMN-binding domain